MWQAGGFRSGEWPQGLQARKPLTTLALREVLLAQGLGRPPYRVGRAFSATVRDRKAEEDFGPRHRALGANAIVAKKSDDNIRLDYLGRFAVCTLEQTPNSVSVDLDERTKEDGSKAPIERAVVVLGKYWAGRTWASTRSTHPRTTLLFADSESSRGIPQLARGRVCHPS